MEFLKENAPNWAYWFSDLAALGWEGENLWRGSVHTINFSHHEGPPRDDYENFCYLTNLSRIRQLPTRLKTPVLNHDKIGNYGQLVPQARRLVEQKASLLSQLVNSFPRWVRPNSWIWQDEYERPSRHTLERQPYW